MNDGALNLTVPRGPKSVWDDPDLSSRLAGIDRERWMTLCGGVGLAFLGLRRGGIAGGALAIAGGVLGVRAAMGHHDLRVARDRVGTILQDRGWRARDVVEDASEESFPASDSPGWTGTRPAKE